MQINLPIADERDAELGPEREMTTADFEMASQAAIAQSLAWIGQQGEASPTVFIPSMGPEGILRMGVMPVGDLISQPVGKDILAMIMERLLEDPNNDFVVFAHEAWTLQATAGDPAAEQRLRDAAGGSIAEHPDRAEALVIHVRSKSRQALCMMPIIRDEHGSITEITSAPLCFPGEEGASIEGRFAAPARPRGATLH